MEKPEWKERHKVYRERHPEIIKLHNLKAKYKRQLRLAFEYEEKAKATLEEINHQQEIIKKENKSYKKGRRSICQ